MSEQVDRTIEERNLQILWLIKHVLGLVIHALCKVFHCFMKLALSLENQLVILSASKEKKVAHFVDEINAIEHF